MEALQATYTYAREEYRYYSAELKRADLSNNERNTITRIRSELARNIEELAIRIHARHSA
jgi:hypothetical protein